MISLGFSVQAELAHQNQERPPSIMCWVKEHLPITNTAGVVSTKPSDKTRSYLVQDKEAIKNFY